MKPAVQAMAKKYGDKITFIVADVQTLEGQALAQQFQIELIPTYFLIQKEKVHFTHTGFIEKNLLEAAIKKVYNQI